MTVVSPPCSEPTDLKELTPDELTVYLADLGKERFRARQLLRWIYLRGVTDFAAMTDLSKEFRSQLQQRAKISSWQPEAVETSVDGTQKYLFRLADGESVETVRIPMEGGRSTLCISTQAGCAMGCRFCLTGHFGLSRNLSAGEIVNQVCAVHQLTPVNNIVLMGMGEPLDNLDNVVRALQILYSDDGFGFGARKVTLSTSGLVPQLRQLPERIRVGLAISLNATTDSVRDQLMPVNRRYPLEQLLAACRDYPLQTRERITFEYILIRGLNDSLDDARRLVRLLHGIKAKINLIPYNEHPGAPYRTPDLKQVEAFQGILLNRGLVAVRRASKGRDISAACGQLKGQLDADELKPGIGEGSPIPGK